MFIFEIHLKHIQQILRSILSETKPSCICSLFLPTMHHDLLFVAWNNQYHCIKLQITQKCSYCLYQKTQYRQAQVYIFIIWILGITASLNIWQIYHPSFTTIFLFFFTYQFISPPMLHSVRYVYTYSHTSQNLNLKIVDGQTFSFINPSPITHLNKLYANMPMYVIPDFFTDPHCNDHN